MPAAYTLYPEFELRVVRITGKVDASEIHQMAAGYHDDPGFSNTYRQLVDLTEFEDSNMGFSSFLTLRNNQTAAYGPLEKSIRIAVAAPTDLAYGLATIFRSLVQGQGLMDLEIFPSMAQAMDWLGGSFPPEFRI